MTPARYVIATAGHVDHGKSSLVRALTGINPDRLREEQEREMTIDLGFAWLTLPGGAGVGIVDVPGHIDFIENMLAGVGSIDAVLLVIAADEGPMPQTREHLSIMTLLRVPRAVVALTKADLAPDAEWLDLAAADIRSLLAPTPFRDAAIVPCSMKTGLGLAELQQAVQQALDGAPPRPDLNQPRLGIDRAFSVAGFGTVVTGALTGGGLSLGDEVEILPRRLPARIRGLQTHKQKLERALPGSRVAINLGGVTVDQVQRGCVVAQPGLLQPTTLLDVRLEALRPLKHHAELKVFCGASETIARLRLLEGSELGAGASGWAQLELSAPVAVAAGDRLIVRLPSPSVTAGGGMIVDANPAQRHRRHAGRAEAHTLEHLDALLNGTPAQRLESVLAASGFITQADAQARSGLSPGEYAAALGELERRQAVVVAGEVICLHTAWQAALDRARAILDEYHAAQPLATGMPRESLRSKLRFPPRDFAVLAQRAVATGALDGDAETLRRPGYRPRFTPEQQRAVDALLAQCQAQPFNTPSPRECRAALGDAAYDALLRQRRLVQVSSDVVFLGESYDEAVQRMRAIIQRDGQITVAQFRDAFNTTRKYALALLEHLDQIGVTRRAGDARVLK